MAPEKDTVRVWPSSLLFGASIGALCGAGWAWLLARQHHPVDLGFRREAWELLREGVGFGLIAGTGLVALLLLRFRLAPNWPATLAEFNIEALFGEIRSRPRALLITLALPPTALVALASREAGLGAVATIGVFAAWLVWSLDYVCLRIARPSGRAIRAAAAATLDIAVALAVAVVAKSYAPAALETLRDSPRYGAIVVAGIAMWISLHAWVGWRRGLSRSEPRVLLWAMTGVGLLALLVSARLWFGPPPDPAVRAEHPWNVILIGIDTLRLDRTMLTDEGILDPESRDLTPNLRRLARRGSVFRNAISQAPWTLPSFASIFTGKYPDAHGANGFSDTIRDRELMVTEILREAGYQTHAVVSHFLVKAERGFDQGFQHYNEDYVRAYTDVTSQNVTEAGLRYLRQRGPEPFFLFLHYFDPHYQYNDHGDWSFADGYDGWLREQMHISNLRHKRHLLEAPDILYLRDLYDEEIAYTDRQIGRLVDYLEQEGLLESTIIVFVSDHGEEFFERGWFGHTISLHEEQIHVPLLFVLPGTVPEAPVVDEVVETRAILPTILDHLGLRLENGPEGRSLIPLMHGEVSPDGSRAFSSTWLPTAPLESGKRVRLSSLRTLRWKLIFDHTRDRAFLYDLAADPQERHNLAVDEPERLESLGEELERWLEQQGREGIAAKRLKLKPEDVERLKSLGYL